MAQLASLASLIGTGVAIYGQVQQGRTQQATAKAQAQLAQQRVDAQAQQVQAQADASADKRRRELARTLASTRARLAAGGVSPDEGSAAALASGLRQDAAAAQAGEDTVLSARLAEGRQSLLRPDGSFTSFVRAGQSLGGVVRNLLE